MLRDFQSFRWQLLQFGREMRKVYCNSTLRLVAKCEHIQIITVRRNLRRVKSPRYIISEGARIGGFIFNGLEWRKL